MPRRIAIQVSQLISRQLRGGLLKSNPVAFQTLVDHPPTPLPSRAPVKRSEIDTPSSHGLRWDFEDEINGKISPKTDAKGKQRKGPKLGPQPIVYLEDRVRERFFNDHPWETLNPRMLVEGSTIVDRSVPNPNATDLTAWGRNPSPDDVIACVVHLHRRHGLSLSQAYHNTLSSYYALRSEHEHASRTALFEARAYGAKFASVPGITGEPTTSAVEISRGFRKEAEQLRKGAKYLGKSLGTPIGRLSMSGAAESKDERASSRKYRFRVNNSWAPVSQGSKYLQAALAARDGSISSPSSQVATSETTDRTNAQADGNPTLILDSNRSAGLNNYNSVHQDRIFVGQR